MGSKGSWMTPSAVSAKEPLQAGMMAGSAATPALNTGCL
jgi:hypothetical protein